MTDATDLDCGIGACRNVIGEAGQGLLGLCSLGTLYFDDAHTPAVREAIMDCLDEYWRLAGDQLRWATHPKTYHWQPIAPDAQSPRDWVVAKDPDESWQVSYQGGASQSEASDYRFEALGTAAWEHERVLSYLHFCLPLTFFADHEGGLPQLLLAFARRLRPVHGYAGIGVIESYNSSLRQAWEPTVYGMAQRFPGLEVDYPISHSLYGRSGIKGVDWLTVIGDFWLDKLGGLAALRDQVGSDYVFSPYPGGVIIQSGPRPELGDRNRNRWPVHYVKLARLLRPIRLQGHRSFHESSLNRFTLESTAAWLARFDDR